MLRLFSRTPDPSNVLTLALIVLLFGLTTGLNTNTAAVSVAFLTTGVAVFSAALGLGVARALRQNLPLDMATLLGLALLLHALAMAVVAFRCPPVLGWAVLLPFAAVGLPRLFRAERTEHGWPVVLLAVIGFSLVWTLEGSWRIAGFTQDGVMRTWSDVLLFSITVAEQGDWRTVPQLNAALAGVPPPFYHFVSFAMPALFVRWLDIPPLTAVTGIWLPTGIAMMTLALAVLGRELAGLAGGALAIIILAALPLGTQLLLGHGFLAFHWLLETVPGTGYGSAIGLLSVALLARHLRSGTGAMLALSALAMALVAMLRIQIFIWLAPAWMGTVVLASPLFPRQARLRVILSGAVLGLAVLVLMVRGGIAHDGLESVLFRYFDLLRMEEGTGYRAVADWLRNALPNALSLPLLAILTLLAPSPWLAAALIGLVAVAAHRRRLEAIDVLPLLLLLWAMAVMSLGPTPAHGDITEYRHRGFPIVVLIEIAWAARLGVRSLSSSGAAALSATASRGLALAACLATVVTWSNIAVWKRPTMGWAKPFQSYSVPLPVQAAGQWLRTHARPGDIFAMSEPDPESMLFDRSVDLIALSGMPVFVSRGGYYRTLGPRFAIESAARMDFLKEIASEDPAHALQRLHERGIAYYVILDGKQPQWGEQAPPAAFAAPGITIFRTGPEP